MAKKGPRSYPNTCWMILGTSKILTFFGPIIGHFWARGHFQAVLHTMQAVFQRCRWAVDKIINKKCQKKLRNI